MFNGGNSNRRNLLSAHGMSRGFESTHALPLVKNKDFQARR